MTAPMTDWSAYTMDSPLALTGRAAQQCGYDIVVGQCPRCGTTVALNGDGRHWCICGLWMRLDLPVKNGTEKTE